MRARARARSFWGTPIPIWISEDGEEVRVLGSIQELEEASGRKVGGRRPPGSRVDARTLTCARGRACACMCAHLALMNLISTPPPPPPPPPPAPPRTPFIDDITIPSQMGKGDLRRVGARLARGRGRGWACEGAGGALLGGACGGGLLVPAARTLLGHISASTAPR